MCPLINFNSVCFACLDSSLFHHLLLCSADSEHGARTHPAPPVLSRHQHHSEHQGFLGFFVVVFLAWHVLMRCLNWCFTCPRSHKVLRVLANTAHKKKDFCVRLLDLGLLPALCATLKMANQEMVTLSLDVLYVLLDSGPQVNCFIYNCIQNK